MGLSLTIRSLKPTITFQVLSITKFLIPFFPGESTYKLPVFLLVLVLFMLFIKGKTSSLLVQSNVFSLDILEYKKVTGVSLLHYIVSLSLQM